MCCSNSFVPRSQPPTSDLEICNPLWTLEQELSEKIIPSTTLWILFFNFSFFCPQPKAEADSFICVSFLLCHLLVSMLRCDYISSFLCRKFFFVFPQILHSGFGRLYQSSDALVGGIVGIRLTPFFVITFFLATLFFSMTQRKTMSLSLLAANVVG